MPGIRGAGPWPAAPRLVSVLVHGLISKRCANPNWLCFAIPQKAIEHGQLGDRYGSTPAPEVYWLFTRPL
jgi:hypothetical protein